MNILFLSLPTNYFFFLSLFFFFLLFIELGKVKVTSVPFAFLETVLWYNIRKSNTEQKLFYCHYLFMGCIRGSPAVNISPVVRAF